MAGLIDSFFTKNKIALLAFLTFGCVCGAVFRYDMEWWDFVNYHYYNAWAFLNDRMNVDILPAVVNSFISPFIDLPVYFLTNALNDHPVVYSAIMAVPYGLMMFVAFKTAALFFDADTRRGRIMIVLSLLLSVCSVFVFMELSGTTHEHSMSFLSLTALYLLLKKLPSRDLDAKTCLISGFLLGIAAGLKMTYCLYAASTGITLILFAKSFDRPVKSVALFALAGTAGFLIAYGYWGWFLWKNFENPFFPFLNGFFQSSYGEEGNYKDVRYFNLPWLNVIFYPVHMFFHIGGDFSMRNRFVFSNLRLIVGMIVFAAAFVKIAKDRVTRKEKDPADDLFFFLIIWMTIAYVIWLGLFRVYRYMIPFDLMLSIVLVRFFFNKATFSLKSFSFAARSFLLLCFVAYTGYECAHLPYSRRTDRPMLPTNIQKVPNDTLLLLRYIPASMFVPFLVPNSTVRAVAAPEFRVSVNGSRIHTVGYFGLKAKKLIAQHQKQGKPVAYIVGRNQFRYSEEEGLEKICDTLDVLRGADFDYYYFLCPLPK